MGNFWGSIHLRTTDRDVVLGKLKAIVAERRVAFYLGPEKNGWLAVYPQDNGQDGALAEAVAAAIGVDAFHLMLHDDDVFAYNFFRAGRRVDEYTSRPGYFSESQRAADEKLAGNVDLYADLLKKPADTVRSLLRRDGDHAGLPFEGDRMTRFAAALGLSNVQTAYEYLLEGETEGVKGWRKFIHLSDTAAEVDAVDEETALLDQLAVLKARGQLLADYAGTKNQQIVCLPDSASNGFLLFRGPKALDGPPKVERVGPPWRKKGDPIDLPLGKGLSLVAISHDGRLLASQGRVIDLQSRQLLHEFESAGWLPAFSEDGRLFLSADQNVANVFSIEDRRRIYSLPVQGMQNASLHPDNKTLLVNVQLHLLIAPLDGAGEPKPLYLGGRLQIAKLMAGLFAKKLKAIDLDKHRSEMKAGMEKSLAKIEQMMQQNSGKSGMPVFDDAARQKLRQDMAANLEKMLGNLDQVQRGETKRPEQAAERVQTMAFSRDGSQLICGTGVGFRIYDWADVVGGGDVKQPKHAFQIILKRPDGHEYPGQVDAIAEDTHRGQIYFGGINGVVYAMDRDTGSVRPTVIVPGSPWIVSLQLSGDGSALAVVCRANMLDERAWRRSRNDNRSFIFVFAMK